MSSDKKEPPSAAESSENDAVERDLPASDPVTASGDPKGIQRERWATPFDFVLACVGFSIGYGNVWRFPYLVYKNGGGAFLIPFFLSALIGGIPVFFLEVIQGQFMSGGAIKVWKMAPLFEGIGFASMVIVFCLNCYYNILLTWSLRYLFASFGWNLPWQTCDNEWNTDYCVADKPLAIYDNATNTFSYMSSRNLTVANATQLNDPAIEYWERRVLDISNGIEEVGYIKWELLLCLIGAWVLVFVCIFNGIRASGRVMYFTATAPFILMFVLMIRGLTLPGAMKGLEFYLKPDFSKLAEPKVWADAGTQIFFSYSISLGVLNALGSYNPWRQNSLRDSFIFSCVDSFTCVVAGFVIFPVLGYMAELRNVDISQVAEQGPGLVFVVYPKAVSLMPMAPVWSVLFFSMLILVGIDSQFCAVEGFCAAIIDFFPKTLAGTVWRRASFVGFVCFIKFLVGLTMITQGGMYVFQILDYYSGCRIIMLVAMAECLVVGWVYGSDRFAKNMAVMWGKPLWPPFRIALKVTWNYITPAYVLGQFLLNSYEYSQALTYKRNPQLIYEFPQWAVGVGWILAYASVICIPLVAAFKIWRLPARMTFAERVKLLCKPVLKPYMTLPGDQPGTTYIQDRSDSDKDEHNEGATTGLMLEQSNPHEN